MKDTLYRGRRVFMAPFADVDVIDVRDTDVIQTTVEWVEENL